MYPWQPPILMYQYHSNMEAMLNQLKQCADDTNLLVLLMELNDLFPELW